MNPENTIVFSLCGILKRGDRYWDGAGTLLVIDKRPLTTFMPFAGKWQQVGKEGFRSLGFSSADYAWQVLIASINQGFNPIGLEVQEIKKFRSDTILKQYLILNGIALLSNW